MAGFWPVYKRELKEIFHSPGTYVVLALFFFISGAFFHDLLVYFSEDSASALQGGLMSQTPPNLTESIIHPVFQYSYSLLLFIVPLLTMRMLAEERNRGTFELLATCPLGDWAILLGKHFALVTLGMLLTALVGMYPLLTWWAGRAQGSAPEWPVVMSCAVGLVLVFSAFSAFGIMTSAMCENQISAGVLALIGLLLWNILSSFQVESTTGVLQVLRELTAYEHTENFLAGILLLRDVLFFILSSAFFLFIAARILDARRWRV